jgi:GT2 family glycosyltransferase
MPSNPSLKTTISVVVPHLNGVPFAEEALSLCLKSLDYRVDEIIVERNDGIGYAAAVNLGLARTTSDYIIIANNDTKLLKGNLFRLCKGSEFVTVPRIQPEPRDNNPRSFYCVPDPVYQKIIKHYGYFLDERFGAGYFEDDDLILRLKELNIPVVYEPSVVVEHLNGGGLSMKHVGEQKWFDINKKVFEDKWKIK